MSSKKQIAAIAITTVALSLGSIGFATADSAKSHAKSKVSLSKSVVKSTTSVNFGGAGKGVGGQGLATILAGLVAKGTLTQAQADAINAAIATARTSAQTNMSAERTANLTLIATTIGIDVTTLQTRLAAGDSLATIAGAKTAALITALVAAETTEIDAAVTAGKITAAQATTLKANLTAAVTARVNGTGGMMRGPRGNRGHHKGGFGSGPMGSGMAPTIPTPTA
ncbi:MAG TPA: hypothetical protein VF307_02405 [Candidatus Nanopelagicaceae bacterium]